MRMTDIVIHPGALRNLVALLLREGAYVAGGSRKWTVQGLGMLRTHLTADGQVRLHVWDPKLAVGASELHTHPWDMTSVVVAGRIDNERFSLVPPGNGDPYTTQDIQCGEGGGLIGEPWNIGLLSHGVDTFLEGEKYSQRNTEVHRSIPSPGTVTMVTREVPLGGNPDIAHVFWPEGEEWVSAEPRPATVQEVQDACGLALGTWF